MGTDRENVVPGNLCIIWKLNEPWPLKKDSVTFLRLLKLLKLKKNSTTALQLKVFNTEKGHHHCIKAFNDEKGLHHVLTTLKVSQNSYSGEQSLVRVAYHIIFMIKDYHYYYYYYYYYYLFIYRWQKMFYIALDKANWSRPKIEKSYIYIKA